MADRLQQFVDNLVSVLEAVRKEIEELVSRFLEAILEFLEDAAKWFERVIKRIVEYAARLLPALGNLVVAMFKLFLLYSPGIICLVVAFFTSGIGWTVTWVIVGVVYAAFVTLVGLSYGRSDGTRSGRA